MYATEKEKIHLLLSFNFDSKYRIYKKRDKYISWTLIMRFKNKAVYKIEEEKDRPFLQSRIVLFIAYYTVARR